MSSLYSCRKLRTDKTVKPNPLKPEPKNRNLLETIETGTRSCLKFKTETKEFWNQTSSICYLPKTFTTIVWNLISLSICLWSRLFISLIKLHAIKWDAISKNVRAATKKYSNQRGLSNFVSLILSIKLIVLLVIIVMLTVWMPKNHWLRTSS